MASLRRFCLGASEWALVFIFMCVMDLLYFLQHIRSILDSVLVFVYWADYQILWCIRKSFLMETLSNLDWNVIVASK